MKTKTKNNIYRFIMMIFVFYFMFGSYI